MKFWRNVHCTPIFANLGKWKFPIHIYIWDVRSWFIYYDKLNYPFLLYLYSDNIQFFCLRRSITFQLISNHTCWAKELKRSIVFIIKINRRNLLKTISRPLSFEYQRLSSQVILLWYDWIFVCVHEIIYASLFQFHLWTWNQFSIWESLSKTFSTNRIYLII